MANRKKHYRWRAYLDDFQMDATGQYVYTGKRYAFDGDVRKRNVYLTKIVLFLFLSLAATVVPQCLPPRTINGTPLTVIPWALQMISVLVLSWTVLRIFAHAAELRAYVWRATVRTLPAKSAVSAGLSGVSLVCSLISLFVNRLSSDVLSWVCVGCPALSAAAAIFLFLTARAGKWNEIA